MRDISSNMRDRKETTFSNKSGELSLNPRFRYILVFQLAPGFEPVGWEFESPRARFIFF